jgi:hypothetical protein
VWRENNSYKNKRVFAVKANISILIITFNDHHAGFGTNVFSYQWHGITATYRNYISFFEGDLLTSDDRKFPSGVSQQIMTNGLRHDGPFARSWIVEAYGIYTRFFQPAANSSYWTIGVKLDTTSPGY